MVDQAGPNAGSHHGEKSLALDETKIVRPAVLSFNLGQDVDYPV